MSLDGVTIPKRVNGITLLPDRDGLQRLVCIEAVLEDDSVLRLAIPAYMVAGHIFEMPPRAA